MAAWRRAAMAAVLLALPACDDGREVAASNEGAEGLLPRCEDVAEVPPPVDGPLSDDEEVAAAQRWRARMGLRSDEEWVRRVDERPGRSIEAHEAEHPLTDDEVREFVGRDPDYELSAALRDYAAFHPDTYSGGRINHARGGMYEVAFTADVEAHRAALAEVLPTGRPVDVVPGEMTEKEANALQRELWDELVERGHPGVIRVDAVRGWAEVSFDVIEPDVERFLARRYPGVVCVEGQRPGEPADEPPQADSGDGWRLLADELLGPPYFVRVALDEAGYEEIWRRLGIGHERPAVDFDDDVVVHFGITYSGSCPNILFEGVRVDEEARTVRPIVGTFGPQPDMCTRDARGHAYVVALDRDELPERFTVWATEGECASCEEWSGERADVDLRRATVDHGPTEGDG